MSKKTKKNPAPHILITSDTGLEAAINQYVETQLSLLRRRAKQERAIAELSAAHAAENAADEGDIVSLETGITLYCTTHRAELFPDETKAKSREFGNATVGFRLHPEALALIVPKDTWVRVAERLEATAWGEKYVSWKPSVDKDAMKKDRADITAAQLAEAGVKYAQEESFFLEPKSDLLEAARTPVKSENTEAVA